MDLDTTLTKHSHEKILAAFAAGEADILIGTQMIAKGHDYPNVHTGGHYGGGFIPECGQLYGGGNGLSADAAGGRTCRQKG